jgi:cobalt/nickel transport system permease protein
MGGVHRHAPPAAVTSGLFAALDVRIRIAATLAIVLAAVTTPRGATDPIVGVAAVVVAVVFASFVPLKYLAKRLLLFAPIVLSLLGLGLLSPRPDAAARATDAALKASLALVACLPLGATTSQPALVQGLSALGLPRTLVLVLGAFVRGVAHLGEEAARLRAAREARAVGGRRLRLSLAGSFLGVLLLRAQSRSERVHVAMLARGFRGEPTLSATSPLRALDLGFASVLVAILVSVRLLP